MDNVRNAGFWIRVAASLIDSILLMLVLMPLLAIFYGPDYWMSDSAIQGPVDFLLSYVAPAVAVILFWIYKSAATWVITCASPP